MCRRRSQHGNRFRCQVRAIIDAGEHLEPQLLRDQIVPATKVQLHREVGRRPCVQRLFKRHGEVHRTLRVVGRLPPGFVQRVQRILRWCLRQPRTGRGAGNGNQAMQIDLISRNLVRRSCDRGQHKRPFLRDTVHHRRTARLGVLRSRHSGRGSVAPTSAWQFGIGLHHNAQPRHRHLQLRQLRHHVKRTRTPHVLKQHSVAVHRLILCRAIGR